VRLGAVEIKITCGGETLALTDSTNPVFSVFENKVSTPTLTYGLTGIWTVAYSSTYINAATDCPIESYMLCSDIACS
jgi:hypothetical protein